MYTQTRKLLLATSVALAMTTLSGTVVAETPSQDVSNARMETQIWTTYALSPYLRASDIKVAVVNGKATLTGKADEDVNKELAEEIALGVNGIKDVDNQIVVQADYKPTTSETDRRYGEVIDDATITAAVKSKLAWSKYTDSTTTKVETRAGKVTLSGTTHSADAKKQAGDLALSTRGVTAVDNKLMVDSKKKKTADNSGDEISDSWITTKVKSTFMYSSNVDGSDISVSTTAGVVTLTGKMDSGVERALAIELAKNVRGVKSVQSKALTI